MATSNRVSELVINNVENQEVYEYMKNNGLINDNELYLVGGANESILYTPQTLTEVKKAQARENIGAIDESEVNELIASAINGSTLTASRALVSDSSGKVAVSAVTSTELGYLDGVTSAVQTQLNSKVKKSGDTMSGALQISKTAADKVSPTGQDLVINYSLPSGGTLTEKNAPGIGFHIGNVGWANFIYDGTFKFVNNDFTNYASVKALKFIGPLEGNASTATKLATARTIDGVSFDGSANITHYGTCSTAAATAAKTVSLTGFTLATGATVTVKFTTTNSASNPTLNVNSTGAKAIYYKGSAISASYLKANYVYTFVYNGTQWDMVGFVDTNSDTKTSSTNTSNKIFLVGATSQSSSGLTTYSHDTAYVDTDGCVYSDGKKTLTVGATMDNIEGGTQTWVFNCGTSTTVL